MQRAVSAGTTKGQAVWETSPRLTAASPFTQIQGYSAYSIFAILMSWWWDVKSTALSNMPTKWYIVGFQVARKAKSGIVICMLGRRCDNLSRRLHLASPYLYLYGYGWERLVPAVIGLCFIGLSASSSPEGARVNSVCCGTNGWKFGALVWR